MTKPTQAQFICYALSHAKRETSPDGALLPCPPTPLTPSRGNTCTAPVTQYLLDERYKNYYAKKSWTRESYDLAIVGWVAHNATR